MEPDPLYATPFQMFMAKIAGVPFTFSDKAWEITGYVYNDAMYIESQHEVKDSAQPK